MKSIIIFLCLFSILLANKFLNQNKNSVFAVENFIKVTKSNQDQNVSSKDSETNSSLNNKIKVINSKTVIKPENH